LTVPSYPLQWPENVPRTPSTKRIFRSPFRTAFAAAVDNVANSLRLFQKEAGVKIEHVVLSTNADLVTRDPADPGAAAWFLMDNQWTAFGVDRFVRVEANVQAIHHIIEARRVELRYGGLAIVRQTFRAFLAIPNARVRPWWEVLAVPQDASRAEIESAFRAMAAKCHPDVGGSNEAMAELNAARAAGAAAVPAWRAGNRKDRNSG
jgi:DnaJ domain